MNNVMFKGSPNGLTVVLNKEVSFELVVNEFKEKLKKNKQFFKGANISIRFIGREVSAYEQELLMQLLTAQNIVGVSFVHAFESQVTEQPQSSIKEKDYCQYHYGIVRSGQEIYSPGHLIVLGDVNPGGLVSAKENVIVLGSLKGNVRAGLSVNSENPFVFALEMYPKQVGIKNVLSQSPDGSRQRIKEVSSPQIAYMKDDQIYVDNLSIGAISHLLTSFK